MKVSKTSKILIGMYLAISLVCILLALTSTDYKGNFVFLQLPLSLAMSLHIEVLMLLGISPTVLEHSILNSWWMSYLVYGGLTMIALLIVGNLYEKIGQVKNIDS